MINFLILTHGYFGAYLVEAAEEIAGHQNDVEVISILPRQTLEEVRAKAREAIEKLGSPEGLILLTDMAGGTPTNIALPLVKDRPKTAVLSGINLYMLISAFSHRKTMGFEALTGKLIEDGRKSVCDIKTIFAELCGK